MKFFLQVFVTLFVIIDPPGIVPVFLGLTRGRSARTRKKLAWQAAVVAFSVIIAFALFGRAIVSLGPIPLRLVSQAASRRNITFVLRDTDVTEAMTRLHDAFF